MKQITALILTVSMLLGTMTACGQETAAPTTQPEMTETTASPVQTENPQTETDPVIANIVISEVMSDNRKLTLGHEQDWVELYNPGDVSVNLSGYYLTDDPGQRNLMALEGYTVPAGRYLTVVLGDNSPFQLSEMGETVYLTCGGNTISELSFGRAEEGAAFDSLGICEYPTPGFANSEAGYRSYLENLTLPDLVISEVLTNNSIYPVDDTYYDLVEVENRSDSPVNLGEYYLTDRWESTKRYHFPDITLEPGAFYLVLCSGNPELGENHAPFSIGTGEETLYLAHRGIYTDALCVPVDCKENESFGRHGNLPVYLTAPTPVKRIRMASWAALRYRKPALRRDCMTSR